MVVPRTVKLGHECGKLRGTGSSVTLKPSSVSGLGLRNRQQEPVPGLLEGTAYLRLCL